MYLRLLMLCVCAAFSLHAVEFLLLTQPKTATHLLLPILSELTGKPPYCPREYMKQRAHGYKNNRNGMFLESGCLCPSEAVEEIWQSNARQGSFIHFHTPYSQEFENYLMLKRAVVFFVKRDPRDQIVSLLNHYKTFGFLDKNVEKISSDDDRLMYMIRHHLKNNLLEFKNWLYSPIACVLDFSKLMGAHGGAASDEDAIGEMRKMAEVLHLYPSDELLKEIYERYFGKKRAFFRGKVGSWRDYFSERHKRAVKKEIGFLLIELGFEKDFNW